MIAEPAPIAVFGNVTLDIICKTVDEVPRHDSIAFQEAAVTPGGCASNTAVQLAQLGDPVYLLARTGTDQAADFLERIWKRQGVDTHLVRRMEGFSTGVSVGLVDSDLQPRFIHTPGANALLDAQSLDPQALISLGVGYLHVAGYFVLSGLLAPGLEKPLSHLQEEGVLISLDVVSSPAMENPQTLWPLLPHLDLFTCNLREAQRITGAAEPTSIAKVLHNKGARALVIKLGADGCLLSENGQQIHLPGEKVEHPLDTTGAGDAFAAGLLSGLRRGLDLPGACRFGNQVGAQAVSYLGAVQLD